MNRIDLRRRACCTVVSRNVPERRLSAVRKELVIRQRHVVEDSSGAFEDRLVVHL